MTPAPSREQRRQFLDSWRNCGDLQGAGRGFKVVREMAVVALVMILKGVVTSAVGAYQGLLAIPDDNQGYISGN